MNHLIVAPDWFLLKSLTPPGDGRGRVHIAVSLPQALYSFVYFAPAMYSVLPSRYQQCLSPPRAFSLSYS